MICLSPPARSQKKHCIKQGPLVLHDSTPNLWGLFLVCINIIKAGRRSKHFPVFIPHEMTRVIFLDQTSDVFKQNEIIMKHKKDSTFLVSTYFKLGWQFFVVPWGSEWGRMTSITQNSLHCWSVLLILGYRGHSSRNDKNLSFKIPNSGT